MKRHLQINKYCIVMLLLSLVGMMAVRAQAPTGAVNGLFSIAEGQYVCFAKGNLQYQASSNTWRFADPQYVIAGSDNSNISSTYNGWIDLFGWGTSGFNHGAVCYQPWSTSTSNTDYYAYGTEASNLYDNSGKADWGYNKISNGGNQLGQWRTLTSAEWDYVINSRPTSSGIRYVKATVNGVSGLILLPDHWNANVYPLNRINAHWVEFTANVISASDWTNVLEAHGAVFLPVANIRIGSSYQSLGYGNYWTANPGVRLGFYDHSSYSALDAWVGLSSSGVYRGYGNAVRLVHTAAPSNIHTITVAANPSTGGKVTGMGFYHSGGKCTLHAVANGHYTFVRWTKNGNTVSTNPTYSFTVTESAHYVAEFAEPVGGNGLLNGVFSIAQNQQVNFSKGNLQYQANTSTWRFAMNQYECMGVENENVSPSYSGWIDLFGWGTSGYNHGANCYQPWSTSVNNGDYYAYGQPGRNLSEQSGKADWGYNAISNGGNSVNIGWRTLTADEWKYLFDTRITLSDIRYAKATVNGVPGVILLPDDWIASLYDLEDINNSYGDYLNNNITDAEWTDVFEMAGAVFLPAVGRMSAGSIVEEDDFASDHRSYGFYWSSSYYDNDHARALYYSGASDWGAFFLNEGYLNARYSIERSSGASVRLARSAQNTSFVVKGVPFREAFGTVSGSGGYAPGQACTLTAVPKTGYSFAYWSEDGTQVSTQASYSFTVTGSRSLVAHFKCNIAATADPSNGGVVSGTGLYNYGTTCTLTASPSANYAFMYWTENGVQVSTSATYSFPVYAAHNLVAHFSMAYSISASANPSGGGTVYGTGMYHYNTTCTLMATANVGYTFVGWTDNGITVSTDASYSFTVTGNRTLSANFVGSVNLGLPSGTLWAPCNVGASTPEEYGYFYAWGETQPKNNYDFSTYQYCNGSLYTITKYCSDASYGYQSYTDNLTVLQSSDDAATCNWGQAWRMPTQEQWQELLDNTTHTWTTRNGVSGMLFTASNGNSLFMPASGHRVGTSTESVGSEGYYWSSTLSNVGTWRAWIMGFTTSQTLMTPYISRCYGHSVRPVRSGTQNFCHVNVTASPMVGGTVTGAGYYSQGSSVTLVATPNVGFAFVRWTKNGNQVSTNPSLNITVTGSANYVAEFVEDCIVFADDNVKNICVANWDINGSGELSYSEAEAVTSLGSAFRYKSEITSFDELQYFTGLTEIASNSFWSCTALASMTLPSTITSIGSLAFYGCSGMASLTSLSATPPTADMLSLYGIPYTVQIYVPCGSIASYQSAEGWSDYPDYHGINCSYFEIEVVATPASGGMVTGAGTYNSGSTCTLTATPNTGYSFVRWMKDGNQVSTNPSYSFTVAEDASYMAVFSQNSYVISVSSSPSAGGSVSGGGTYVYGATCTVTATANAGYQFVNWTEGGGVVSSDACYMFAALRNRTLCAHFVEVAVEVEQAVELAAGWTWLSGFIETSDELFAELKDGIAATNSTALIKDMNSSTMLANGIWSASDLVFVNEKMYMTNMANAALVSLTAAPADPAEHPITIGSGWNWIGYISSNAMSISEALSSLAPSNGDLIKNMTSASSYSANGWAGNLVTLEPGSGYMYYNAGAEMTLTYPASAKGVVNSLPEERYWSTNVHEHPSNLVMMATLDESQFPMAEGAYEIGAFVDGDCRGSARLQQVVNGYVAFLVIHGEAQEAINFKLYDVMNATEAGVAEEQINYVPNAISGSVEEPVVLHFRSATGVNENREVVNLYPNPADKEERIRIELPSFMDIVGARVEVYDTLGKLITTSTFNGSDVELEGMKVSGLYTVKVSDRQGYVYYAKLVVK